MVEFTEQEKEFLKGALMGLRMEANYEAMQKIVEMIAAILKKLEE